MTSLALRAVVAAAVAAPVVASVPAVAAAQSACPVVPSHRSEAVVDAKQNAARRARGAVAFERDGRIDSAAQRWSGRMARRGGLEHSALGWASGPRGENVAMAPTAAGAYQAMYNSPLHRKNMLDGRWRRAGIGVVVRCDGMHFVTVGFAT